MLFINIKKCYDNYKNLSFLFYLFFGHVGSQFPDQGLNPRPQHWMNGALTTGLPGISPNQSFLKTNKRSVGLPWWFSGKDSACHVGDLQEMQVQSLGQEDPLEKEMATHSSILVWRIPRTEKPGGLQSMGSRKCWT